jgi:Lon-like ATP-dependent protease
VAIKLRGKEESGSIALSGNLGEVMEESAEIAYTFAKSYLDRKSKEHGDFFHRHKVHFHIPDGGTPKDGPSAGSVVVTCLLSLATGRPIPSDTAMTGEITLTGRIIRVGGIREKVTAAGREGFKRIIMPADCRDDYDDLPADIKEGIEPIFVSHYDEVYDIMFTAS